MTVVDIENKLIEVIKNTGSFRIVLSAGRKGIPEPNSFPVAYVYLAGQQRTESRPRPCFDTSYNIIVGNKNLTSEKNSADDTYKLISDIYSAVEGKTFGFKNITPFEVYSIAIQDCQYNTIFYEIVVKTKLYMLVPKEE